MSESIISNVLFSLKVGYYYSPILQEDISKDLEHPLSKSYQVPSKGDLIKETIVFDDGNIKKIEYTLEVQSVHYELDDWGDATIKVNANVINEKIIEEKEYEE